MKTLVILCSSHRNPLKSESSDNVSSSCVYLKKKRKKEKSEWPTNSQDLTCPSPAHPPTSSEINETSNEAKGIDKSVQLVNCPSLILVLIYKHLPTFLWVLSRLGWVQRYLALPLKLPSTMSKMHHPWPLRYTFNVQTKPAKLLKGPCSTSQHVHPEVDH